MKACWLSLVALISVFAGIANGDITVIAVTGETAPDGNGRFGDFDVPSMNRFAQVAFVSSLTDTTGGNTDNTGIFRGTGAPGSLTVIVRRGTPSPDANGNFSLFDQSSRVVINDSGQVAFIAGLAGTFGGGLDDTGLFRGDGTPQALTALLRSGQALTGVVTVPNLRGGGLLNTFAFNDVNQVVLTFTGFGIFRATGGPITPVVEPLQPIPDGNGSFIVLLVPALNDSGQVAFADAFNGVFRADESTILSVVRVGMPSPDGNGAFSTPFTDPALSDGGDVAFFATLNATSGSATDNQGIFLRRGDTLMTVVRRGQSAPDGNGRFLELGMVDGVAINDAGQVAFLATLTATAGGASDNTGLFRGDGNTLTQIVRTGDRAPDGSMINSVGRPAFNAAGQVAFVAGLVPVAGGTTGHGILLYDDTQGLLQAVRTGDPLLGSRIAPSSTLLFIPGTTFNGRRRGGLNEQGQVVFRFDLDDGRRGIAVADALTTSGTNTPTASPTPTPTRTLEPITPTASPTGSAVHCIGDCDGNGGVTINELIQLVDFRLGTSTDCSTCPSGIPPDVVCPTEVTVTAVLAGVHNALTHCPN